MFDSPSSGILLCAVGKAAQNYITQIIPDASRPFRRNILQANAQISDVNFSAHLLLLLLQSFNFPGVNAQFFCA